MDIKMTCIWSILLKYDAMCPYKFCFVKFYIGHGFCSVT